MKVWSRWAYEFMSNVGWTPILNTLIAKNLKLYMEELMFAMMSWVAHVAANFVKNLLLGTVQ
jgi:hypothetical protein